MPNWPDFNYESLKLEIDEEREWRINRDRLHKGDKYSWSEKTVEARFIQAATDSRRSSPPLNFAPLAGGLERLLGDLVAEDQGYFEIVEFKASKQKIHTELNKFRRWSEDVKLQNYQGLFPYLRNYIIRRLDRADIGAKAPHRLFFGYEKDGELHLKSQGYWGNSVGVSKFNKGEFVGYVLALSYFRQPPKNGGLSGLVHAVVGDEAQTLDLTSVVNAVQRFYGPELDHTFDHTTPRM